MATSAGTERVPASHDWLALCSVSFLNQSQSMVKQNLEITFDTVANRFNIDVWICIDITWKTWILIIIEAKALTCLVDVNWRSSNNN